MRTELNNNATLLLKDGNVAHVNKIIGSGGQGFVYSVTVDGEEYALKWYKQNPGNAALPVSPKTESRRHNAAVVLFCRHVHQTASVCRHYPDAPML